MAGQRVNASAVIEIAEEEYSVVGAHRGVVQVDLVDREGVAERPRYRARHRHPHPASARKGKRCSRVRAVLSATLTTCRQVPSRPSVESAEVAIV